MSKQADSIKPNNTLYRVFFRGGRDVENINGALHEVGQHNGVLRIYAYVHDCSTPVLVRTFKDWEHVEVEYLPGALKSTEGTL